MAEVNPYSQTANDPTTQLGLMQVLQQIQALQNRPLIPDNPLSQLGAALQGASAAYAGKPNPAMQQAMAQRQQQLAGMSQTAGIMGQLNTIQQQRAMMEETRRARKVQEDAEKRQQGEAVRKIADDAWKRAVEMGDPDMAVIPYDTLSKLYPGFYPTKSRDEVRAMVSDKISRETFLKDRQGMATAAFFGQSTYRGTPIPEDVRKMSRPALAALIGKTETQLLHGSLEDWEVGLRKKANQVGLENLTPEERAQLLSLMGRNASDAKEAAIADIQADLEITGKPTKPLGEYFRIARERADLSQPVKDVLKSKGVDVTKATPNEITAARDQVREEDVVDAARKSIRTKAVQEANARRGGKKMWPEFRHLPDDYVDQLAKGDENFMASLFKALGITANPSGAAPSATLGGERLKNGKTIEQAIRDGMKSGKSRTEVEAEIAKLRKAGEL